jgi:hypothetical protein
VQIGLSTPTTSQFLPVNRRIVGLQYCSRLPVIKVDGRQLPQPPSPISVFPLQPYQPQTSTPLHHNQTGSLSSYTWGPPEDGMEEYKDCEKEPTIINGHPFPVFPNLMDALCHIRQAWDFIDPVQHIWIDAICL